MDAGIDLITPALDGTILPGVTRDCILSLGKTHVPDASSPSSLSTSTRLIPQLHPQERTFTISDIVSWLEQGVLLEAFGTGTASIICPVSKIGWEGKDLVLPEYEEGVGPVSKALWERIVEIQEGRRESEWSSKFEHTLILFATLGHYLSRAIPQDRMNGYQPFQLTTILQNGGGGGAGTPLDTRYSECIAVQGTFMMALQNHIAKAKEEIKARKETHTKRQQEDEERKKEMEREIEECAAKEVKMIEQVKRERAEVAELEAHVLSLEKQQANTTENFHRKEEEIEELKKDIFRRKGVLSRDKEVLETHARRTAREAKELQDALGWTIEGVQKDMLLFRFTHIDPAEPEKEFNIVLDVSSRTYRVTSSTPLLGTLPTLLEELNETRQFYAFVRRLREAFRVQAEEERRYK
ncbi:hypothetical protein FRC04_001535 [Tulasnella sp. 424]|nr:hypothetical protein FRC04_001535 [Tulasnella sp. 424]